MLMLKPGSAQLLMEWSRETATARRSDTQSTLPQRKSKSVEIYRGPSNKTFAALTFSDQKESHMFAM